MIASAPRRIAPATGEPQLRPPGRTTFPEALEILRALTVKQLKLKYKRSLLGFGWSLATPVALTGIYLFVFSAVYDVPRENFALFLLCGLLPWQFLSVALLTGTTSIVRNAPAIRTVAIPRVLIPLSVVLSGVVAFVLSLAVLAAVLLATGRPLWTQLHWLAVAVVLTALLAFAAALLLSVVDVFLRDVEQVLAMVLPLMFFGTPVVYELSQVPDRFQPLLLANPATGIVETFRSALFEASPPAALPLVLAAAETAALLALGWWVFARTAPVLAKEL